jgi:hypothetical protein
MEKIDIDSPKLEEALKRVMNHHSLRKFLPQINLSKETDFYKKHTFYKKSEG